MDGVYYFSWLCKCFLVTVVCFINSMKNIDIFEIDALTNLDYMHQDHQPCPLTNYRFFCQIVCHHIYIFKFSMPLFIFLLRSCWRNGQSPQKVEVVPTSRRFLARQDVFDGSCCELTPLCLRKPWNPCHASEKGDM